MIAAAPAVAAVKESRTVFGVGIRCRCGEPSCRSRFALAVVADDWQSAQRVGVGVVTDLRLGVAKVEDVDLICPIGDYDDDDLASKVANFLSESLASGFVPLIA